MAASFWPKDNCTLADASAERALALNLARLYCSHQHGPHGPLHPPCAAHRGAGEFAYMAHMFHHHRAEVAALLVEGVPIVDLHR